MNVTMKHHYRPRITNRTFTFFSGWFHGERPGAYCVESACNETHTNTSKNLFVFVPIWKCANNQIRFYLQQQCNLTYVPQAGNNQSHCVLTVVRDPISHFLSGYNEIEFRYLTNFSNQDWTRKVPILPYMSKEVGSLQRVSHFLRDFLGDPSAKMSHWIFSHIYSMSRVLPQLQQSGMQLTAYLPTLDNLTYAWPAFMVNSCPNAVPATLRNMPMIMSLGEHESSVDPTGSYQAAKRVWDDQGLEAMALCVIHAMDYACWRDLPGGVPPLCHHIYSDPSFLQVLQVSASRSSKR